MKDRDVFHVSGRIIFMLTLILSFFGCKERDRISEVSSDLVQLKKLCHVPDYVKSCRWQTYAKGNDWGLLMVVRIDIESVPQDNFQKQPRGMIMIGLDDIPGWLNTYSISLDSTQIKGMFRTSETTYEPDIFKKSPLIHGFLLKIDEQQWLIGLHTQ